MRIQVSQSANGGIHLRSGPRTSSKLHKMLSRSNSKLNRWSVFSVVYAWSSKLISSNTKVRATESLLSLSHTLKLLFLLNKEDEGSAKIEAAQREEALKELQRVKAETHDVLDQVLANR